MSYVLYTLPLVKIPNNVLNDDILYIEIRYKWFYHYIWLMCNVIKDSVNYSKKNCTSAVHLYTFTSTVGSRTFILTFYNVYIYIFVYTYMCTYIWWAEVTVRGVWPAPLCVVWGSSVTGWRYRRMPRRAFFCNEKSLFHAAVWKWRKRPVLGSKSEGSWNDVLVGCFVSDLKLKFVRLSKKHLDHSF